MMERRPTAAPAASTSFDNQYYLFFEFNFSFSWKAGARISQEKDWTGKLGQLGRVSLEEKAGLESWGTYFSKKKPHWIGKLGHVFLEKRLDWKAGARISQDWVGKLGRVFLEKKVGLESCDTYFSRTYVFSRIFR